MKNLSNNKFCLSCYNNSWVHTEFVSAIGYAYVGGNKLLNATELTIFFNVASESEWTKKLQECNGIFAVVCHNRLFSAAAIDSTRLHPIYYRLINEQIVLTDSPYTLIQKGDTEDYESVRFYTTSGATFEGKTLIQDILQIKPNHYLLCNGEQKEYYSYKTSLLEIHMPTFTEMSTMLDNVFQRLNQKIGKHQVVIPLSGGYDSRLVLCMLKRLGCQDVLCYTVGREGNHESNIARKVALQLGYKWYNIDSTQDNLRQLIDLKSSTFQNYYMYLGGLCNFVWLFDYVAITYLQQQGLLKEDAIFIPGHAADFNAGSHLRKACIHQRDTISYLTSGLLFDNFEYQGQKYVRPAIYNYFSTNKEAHVADWSLFQAFIFQNRLPHNILNSARIYAYMGYETALPFWDREFIEMFRKMPYQGLKNQSFYTEYVRTQVFQPMQVDYISPSHSAFYYYLMKIKKRIKAFLPINLAHCFVHLQDSLGEKELSQPLLKELIQKSIYRSMKDVLCINQIMKDWYLLKVREYLQKEG